MDMIVEEQAIFESAGQAVHVAFLVMSQPAMQDAPLRLALIRILESIKLTDGNQRNWLDQLRGTPSGNVNFGGLSGGEVRAQCALITQAVQTNLPNVERWVLQAKYGETNFEDIPCPIEAGVSEPLETANAKVAELRAELEAAQAAISPWSPGGIAGSRSDYERVRTAQAMIRSALAEAEREQQVAQVAFDQVRAVRCLDNGPAKNGGSAVPRRRFAFSAERIAAIHGLSEYFAPLLPTVKPLAIDCMLGRMFATHKKIEISLRDIAAQFGGSPMKYMRAAYKLKNHIRILEEMAIARLEPVFVQHGVIASPQQML